jgi:pimeloyl-ACP methyl ester carboxylesterase
VIDQFLFIAMNANVPKWDNFMGWDRVVEGLESDARVCIYNRQGVGGSDMVRTSTALRTTEDQVSDLVGLIEALELDTPVVLIGNSAAGFNLLLIADRHPQLVAGLVFAEASHPDQVTLLGGAPASAPEYLDVSRSAVMVGEVDDLGDLPVYVLTAESQTRGDEGAIWLTLQEDLSAMSSVSRHDIVAGGAHAFFGTSPDEIVAATLWVIEQADFDS